MLSRAASGADEGTSPLVRAADRLVGQIQTLVTDVEELRAENAALRKELRAAVGLLQRACEAVGNPAKAPRVARAAKKTRGRPRGRAKNAARGRATPADVTPAVVRAVIAKLGVATASDIAAEISRAGVAVNGRAIRFFAEQIGAVTELGPDGRRRYRLGG